MWVWIGGTDSINVDSNNYHYGTQGVPDSLNYPAGDYEYVYWKDNSNNIWIYGGTEIGYEDMWKFNTHTHIWTWIKGPNALRIDSVPPTEYGIKGVPSVTNNPGYRGWGCASWTDANGDLWLFGGGGKDTLGNFGVMNDLWRYNIASNEWTWISGPSLANDSLGHYGTYQVPDVENIPPARSECTATWVYNNHLYLFGGCSAKTEIGALNDVWSYSVSDNTWSWMSGLDTLSLFTGNYGMRGVESATNIPPPRAAYTQWTDDCGNYYLWGGTVFTLYQINNAVFEMDYSDVWRYNNVTNRWTWMAGDSLANSWGNSSGYCIRMTQIIPLSRMENRTPLLLSKTNCLYGFGGDSYAANGALNDLWTYWPQTNDWEWLSGTTIPESLGNYGHKGVLSGTNMPPSRFGHVSWIDQDGNLWVFSGRDGNTVIRFNDLWEYIPDSTCLAFKPVYISQQGDSA